MNILDHTTVYSGANTPEYSSCAFPGICQLKSGTLLASFKGAVRKIPDNATDRAVTVFSYDNGKNLDQTGRAIRFPCSRRQVHSLHRFSLY